MAKKSLKISQNKYIVRFVLGLVFTLSVLATLALFSPKTHAQSSQTLEENYLEIARQKKYIGGQDEEDLKVLEQLPNSKNKKQKTDEAGEGF